MLPRNPAPRNEKAFENPTKEQDKTEILVPKHLVSYIAIRYTKEEGQQCNPWDANFIKFQIGYVGSGGNNPFVVKFHWPLQRVHAELLLRTCEDMFNFGWYAKGTQLSRLIESHNSKPWLKL